jgi:hypothetical protein
VVEKLDGGIPMDTETLVLSQFEQEIVSHIYDTIKQIMERIGRINGLHVFVVRGDEKNVMICETPDESIGRDMLAMQLRLVLASMKPDFIMTVSEAWAISRKPAEWKGELPSKAKDKLEICAFTFEASDGRRGLQTLPMLRDADGMVHLPDIVLAFMAKHGGPGGRLDNLLGDVSNV